MGLDYRRYPVLFVDDEPQNQVAFRYAMEDQFSVLTATGGADALRLLEEHDVAVLLTDQRMPHMSGVELCAQAAARHPNAMRIIVTAYADVHVAIDAINSGQVNRYVLKPWRNEELSEVLQTCIDFVHLRGTMHDMELRLLSSGQNQVAEVVRGEFLHEFANPLGALAMNLDSSCESVKAALKALDSSGDRGQQAVRTGLQAALSAQQDSMVIVEELCEMAHRMQRGDRVTTSPTGSNCDAARVVDATVRIVRGELERVAEVTVALETAPTVVIDPSALGRVVLNLLLNAAQAVGGMQRERHRITVSVTSNANEALIRVQDSGPGIAESERARVFQPYVTTKAEGSGLGLSVVRDSVLQVGGRVAIHDADGGGASFEVHLPLAKD